MNDAVIPTNPALAKALRILADLSAEDGDAGADWTGALVSELSPLLPPPARSDAWVGAYVTGLGLRWHADQLVSLCQVAPPAPAVLRGPPASLCARRRLRRLRRTPRRRIVHIAARLQPILRARLAGAAAAAWARRKSS